MMNMPFKIKPPEITATGVLALVGVGIAAYLIYKVTNLVPQVLKDIKTNLETHGQESAKSYTPQSLDMQAITGRVYSDPMVNNAGMNFIYF